MVLIGSVNIKQWHECLTERGNDKSSHFTTIFDKMKNETQKYFARNVKKVHDFLAKINVYVKFCEL